MRNFTRATEKYRVRPLLAPQTTGSGTAGFLVPTPGVMGITIRALVKMGNAADLALTLRYADNTSGTNAADFPVNVPVFRDGVRQANAKAHTVTDDSGNFIVDFCVDPGTIPQGKTIGLAYGSSNAANILSVELIEDVAYKPTAS